MKTSDEEENPGTELPLSDLTEYKYIGARVLQVLFISAFMLGGVWITSDLMATTLVGLPVSSVAIMMLIYGVIGSVASEIFARHWEGQLTEGDKFPD